MTSGVKAPSFLFKVNLVAIRNFRSEMKQPEACLYLIGGQAAPYPAVHTVFAESLWTSIGFSLRLDEAITNADEYRGDAISQLTIDIAGPGRQIVYVTLQNGPFFRYERRAQEHNEDPIHVPALPDQNTAGMKRDRLTTRLCSVGN